MSIGSQGRCDDRDATAVMARLEVERWMRIVAFGIIGGMAIANVIWTLQTWPMGDFESYWLAGERIRDGEPLYVYESTPTNYRYAPWWAWAWAPITSIPREVVEVVWIALLLAATVAVVIPFVRAGPIGWAMVGLFGPLLFAVTGGGNVQPLLVCALLYGIDRRSGPLWIAIAASLKATPIILALVYLARRQWGRLAVTLILTAVLVAPMALYDLDPLLAAARFTFEPGLAASAPAAYPFIAAAAVGAVIVLALRRSRWTRLGGAAAVIIASPRLFAYDTTLMLVVPPDQPDGRDSTMQDH